MRLGLDDDRELLRETFAAFFAAESTPDRVRAAEPTGFDAALWKQLAETGALGVRVPEAAGGGGAGLLDAALIAEEAGRRLASGPFLEAVVAARLLAESGGADAAGWLERALDGSAVVSLALRPLRDETAQQVPGGAVADAVVALQDDGLVLLTAPMGRRPEAPANLGAGPLAPWSAAGAERTVLASGDAALRAFAAAQEEWKLLMAAALAGLAREALEIAGRYASERVQFDRPIGAFQGVAHPLADSVADVEGARLLAWRAIWAIGEGRPEAAALVSMAFFWSSRAATRAVARALHTHGGYGLSLEYDVQLYHRRGKAWPLAFGDPQEELLRVADRLFDAAPVPLPEAGACGLDFTLGSEAEAFAEEARDFFRENLTDELREHSHFAWEGHHVGFQRALARAGLLYPAWPSAYGGQDRGPYDMTALAGVFHEFGWTRHAISTSGMVAETLMRFGSEELKQEVLPRIARGDAICSLGYTEPGSGSDVAAARTRAERDGDDWVIDGQKMFTSGANLTQYVFLLTRTNSEVPKHSGLTMFLVPLDAPGIEIQPVETLSDERTHATYYAGVRVPDRYRVGDVDGGWAVVAYALELEHGGGLALPQRSMLEGAVAWAREARRGHGVALERVHIRERLARVAVHTEVADALGCHATFAQAEGLDDPVAGPMVKFFSADRFIEDAADLMDLCAPDSLLQGRRGGGSPGAAAVEFAYRLSTAMSIYGGTSEIMKSIVAQVSLRMPRSRS